MRNINIEEYRDKISRLVEYARSGKNPSIWWNGVEYKWDKKHGKYLHWSTLPNGEKRADEPPYEAMNPLFAAAGVPETTDDKKEEPKVEKKEEKKPEPVVEPEIEPEVEVEPEPEVEPGIEDVPQEEETTEEPVSETEPSASEIPAETLDEIQRYQGLFRKVANGDDASLIDKERTGVDWGGYDNVNLTDVYHALGTQLDNYMTSNGVLFVKQDGTLIQPPWDRHHPYFGEDVTEKSAQSLSATIAWQIGEAIRGTQGDKDARYKFVLEPKIDGEKEELQTEETVAETPQSVPEELGSGLYPFNEHAYSLLMDKTADVDTLQRYGETHLGEPFSEEEIGLVYQAKDAVNNSDILPSIRNAILNSAYDFLTSGKKWSSNKEWLQRQLSSADKSASFEKAQRLAGYTGWNDARFARAKSREDLARMFSEDCAATWSVGAFLSDREKAEFKVREKKLLKLIQSPTTSEFEALFVGTHLNEVNQTVRQYGRDYRDLLKKDAENETNRARSWLKEKWSDLDYELGRLENEAEVLRKRAQKAKEEHSEIKPDDPEKTLSAIDRNIDKLETFLSWKKGGPRPRDLDKCKKYASDTFEQVVDDLSQNGFSLDDLAPRFTSSADNVRETIKNADTEHSFVIALHSMNEALKAKRDEIASGYNSPETREQYETRQKVLTAVDNFEKLANEYCDNIKSDLGYHADLSNKARLAEGEVLSMIKQAKENNGLSNSAVKEIESKVLKIQQSVLAHERAVEILRQAQPGPESAPQEESVATTPKSASEILKSLPSMSVSERAQGVKDWAKKFFGDDHKVGNLSIGKIFGDEHKDEDSTLGKFFLDDDVPLYAKKYVLDEMRQYNREKGFPPLESIDSYDEWTKLGGYGGGVPGRLMADKWRATRGLGENWKTLSLSDDSQWNSMQLGGVPMRNLLNINVQETYEVTQINSRKDDLTAMNSRDTAIEFFSNCDMSFPRGTKKEDKGKVKDACASLMKIAALPTTTDYEAASMVLGIKNAYGDARSKRAQWKTDYNFADEFIDKLKMYVPEDAIQEIADRAAKSNASAAPEPETKPEPVSEPEPEPTTTPEPEPAPEPEPIPEPETSDEIGEQSTEPEETPISQRGALKGPDGYYPINLDLAKQAHQNMSFREFNPNQALNFYRGPVENMRELAEKCKSRLTEAKDRDRIDGLLDSYERKLANWVDRYNKNGASCPSVMVTGAGNFPVRKKEKQIRNLDKLMKEQIALQTKYETAIKGTGYGGISSDDNNAVAKLEAKLASLEKFHQDLSEANKYFHKNKKSWEGYQGPLQGAVEQAKSDSFSSKRPLYTTNVTAEIRRLKGRIEELKTKASLDFGVGWNFDGGHVIPNKEENRIEIYHDEKPDRETIDNLKRSGFRWSPKKKAWQRMLNSEGIWAAKSLGYIPKDWKPTKQSSDDKPEPPMSANHPTSR